MKRRILFLSLILSFAFAGRAQQQSLSGWVNPMIGTGGHGHTYPGALVPFGMMQLSPDTRLSGWDGCSGYHYSDSVIYGFSHTHLSGTGCSDYGDVLIMPTTNPKNLEDYGYASPFSHSQELATAGYYRVFLDKPGVTAELTATKRCGMHRYTFSQWGEQWLVVDLKHRDMVLGSKLEVVDDHTLRGYRFSKAWAENQKLFFEIKFSRPFIKTVKSKLGDGLREQNNIMAFQFAKETAPLLVKVGISGVDEEGAHKNLTAEIKGLDFDKCKKEAQADWNEALSKIVVDGGMDEQRIVFYTALYHCMSAPNIYSDVDGRYRGRDDKLHSTNGKFDYYTVFSLWDTYRGEHPLLTLIDPKRTNDFINTFIAQYEQGGRLPVWELSSNETECMIGNHAIPVIWDAYSKGIRKYDAEKAFAAMKHSAMMDHFGLASYKKYGVVRSEDESENVSRTLEYAYDDWCIAQMAKALHKTDDYNYFMRRSQNWKNVFDPTTGFMRPRFNGMLYNPFSPYTVDNNFTEANSWQYSYYVPQDVPGLIRAMGGKARFEAQLDALFTASNRTEGRDQADITGLIGQYAHGNEPSHHIAYLYNYVGKPEKTQAIVRRVMNNFYRNAPDGLIGNEDCGQMSAWYVLSAMGLYPVCPGSGNVYEPGARIFDRVTINLDNGDSFILPVKKGQPNLTPVVFAKHTGKEQPAMIGEIVPNPFIENATKVFRDQQVLKFGCLDPKATIFYALNGSGFNKYTQPVTIDANTTIRFYAANKQGKSPVQEGSFMRLPTDRSVMLHSTYNKQYTAGGPDGLIDGVRGTVNWRSGNWQGFQKENFEGIVTFKEPVTINHIKAGFLQDQRAWIFYPRTVSFYTSEDGEHWQLLRTVDTHVATHDEKVATASFGIDKRVTAKYIKVQARQFGTLPSWHEGAGNDTFIFIDEIMID